MRFIEKISVRTESDDWSNYRGRPEVPVDEQWRHRISDNIDKCVFHSKKLKAVHPSKMMTSNKDLHNCSGCGAFWKDRVFDKIFRPKGADRKNLFKNVPTGIFEDDKQNASKN